MVCVLVHDVSISIASAVDRETMDLFLFLQEIRSPQKREAYQEVIF